MTDRDTGKDLEVRSADYVVSAARAALGAVPFVGSLFIELIGNLVPNQRTDRLVKFAQALKSRIDDLEEDSVRSQFESPEFRDLLEQAMLDSARSLSDERREYIASLVATSLSSQEIEYQESKHLLRLLGELTDVEVLWLRFYAVPTLNGDREFRQRHKDVFEVAPAYIGAPRSVLDKAALRDSYKEHLAQLGLLKPTYETDMKTGQPKFDRFSGGMKIRSYEITSMGRLLLRQIGVSDGLDAG